MADINDGISQRKGMAMGKGALDASNFGVAPLSKATGGGSVPSGGFGVEGFSSVNGGRSTMPAHSNEMMGDDNRATGPHVSRGGGKMPGTRNSDHGPHGDFGVEKLSST